MMCNCKNATTRMDKLPSGRWTDTCEGCGSSTLRSVENGLEIDKIMDNIFKESRTWPRPPRH